MITFKQAYLEVLLKDTDPVRKIDLVSQRTNLPHAAQLLGIPLTSVMAINATHHAKGRQAAMALYQSLSH